MLPSLAFNLRWFRAVARHSRRSSCAEGIRTTLRWTLNVDHSPDTDLHIAKSRLNLST